ncbi:MAG TPA: 30S ribosomal protein S20 [Clostridiales bacterium]|nr:30S ribosomal protein S20 [Clostridiales bacterium]
MPNTKSAAKRVLVNRKRYERNKAYRSALKTALKKANAAVESKADNMNESVRFAIKMLDKAAAKGIIHKNAAARRKSVLTVRLNKATAN